MGVKSEKVENNKENIVDDLSENEELEVTEKELEDQKLEKLRAKMAAKQAQEQKESEVPARIVEEKTRSIRFGVVGSGQAGGRLAERWYKLGYPAVVMNTAPQDLEYIDVPAPNKLLLDHGLGGAAKELDIGYEAAEMHKNAINELIYDRLSDAQLLLFCTSLGGGSGAGSAEVIVDLLAAMQRPVVVLTVLPMSTEDAQTKQNALTTLAKFTKYVEQRKIDNLIVVDNARIEALYSDVSQMNFFSVSNQAIVEPIDEFNRLSNLPSEVKGLDPTEFGKLFTDSRGLTVYGTMKVANYEDETAIAEAVIDNLNSSMLASGFDLKQARYVGVLIVANKNVWSKIPNASTNYAMSIINETCANPLAVFKGIYTVDMDEDVVKVYSMFSGLSIPDGRIEQLKKEVKELASANKAKDENRSVSLHIDTGEDEVVSAADAVRKKISTKKSAFGKLHNNAVVDRRKK